MRTLLFIFCLLPITFFAQQSSSKAKSKDKLYDKEGQRHIELINASAINSPNLDFSPVYYQNGIVYVSSRYKAGAVDKKIGETYFELFYSETDAAGTPTKPQEFSVNINSQRHEGPVSFSRDGSRIYFTRSNMEKGKTVADSKGMVRLKVYEAKRGLFDWEELKELKFNSNEYSVMHPAISSDGTKMYFSSDMPGGYGGFDLYVVNKKGAGWTEPVNLGSEINTNTNEAFPFFHESGTLFFSSEGHQGYGGLDIFRIDLSNELSPGKVVNLGHPFNSKEDDLGFILHPDANRGYLTSGRKGGVGKDDIYFFKAPEGLNGLREIAMSNLQIIVSNAETGQRLSDAKLRFIKQSADGFLEDKEYYDVNLQPSSNNNNELVMTLRRKNSKDLPAPTLATDKNGELVHPVESGQKYLILISKEGYHNEELLLTDNTKDVFKVLLKEDKCTTLGGKISANNAPISDVKVSITNNCTGETEVINTNAQGEIYACIQAGCDYQLVYQKEGFLPFEKKLNLKNTNSNIDLSAELNTGNAPENTANPLTASPIKKGSVILLENIYYDFNKSAIRKGDAQELESLARLMLQYPSMKIDLIAHTDSRGTAEYNMELSVKRAESAKQFLINRGIKANRVNAFGYGETQPRNSCIDGIRCSEEEHQYNRRTEVKITSLDDKVEIKYGN